MGMRMRMSKFEQMLVETMTKGITNMKKFYVTMTDSFMSGWGMAEGKINKLVIECDNLQQAEEIENYAKKRNEMKHISISYDIPKYNSKRYYVSWKTYNDMPGWRD